MAAELFEIFFYAAIAIAIFIRLHSILGRASESGSQEQKSFAGFKLDKVIDIVQEECDNSMKTSDDEMLNVISAANPQDVLSRIKHLATLDASFVVKNFIKCAESAYEAIINAFTVSDLKQLGTLVDGEMLKKFASMIDERKARNEIQEAIVVSINECKIEDVVVTAKKASITVKIKSEQIIVIRNVGNNEIKHGNPDRPQKLEDKFTFTKKVGSPDPVWLLSAIA